jgi:hypothetical protein
MSDPLPIHDTDYIPIHELAIIWQRGARVGSVRQAELPVLRESFSLSLIQRDVSGCEHWNVLGKLPKGKGRHKP